MKFCEDEKSIITVPKYENCFVYFLLKNNEVVYIGQTKNGITRPLSHKNKDFDTIKIKYCDEKELDITEDEYIKKYKPIYNKQLNYAINWGLERVRNKVREYAEIPNYTIPRLRKLLNELKIVTQKDKYTGKEVITYDEYVSIIKYIQEVKNNARNKIK